MITQPSALAMLSACDEARVALLKWRDVECGMSMTALKKTGYKTPYLRRIDALLATLTHATDAARADLAKEKV